MNLPKNRAKNIATERTMLNHLYIKKSISSLDFPLKRLDSSIKSI